MKKLCTLTLIIFCITSVYAQKIPVSLNGSYRTEIEDWGIGAHAMIPVYKNLYIAPNINYFFGKEYNINSDFLKSNVKSSTLNYGIDIHYGLHFVRKRLLASPFVGVEGVTTFSDFSGSSRGIMAGGGWSSWRDMDGGSINDFDVLGNVGVAGKWFVADRIFINTQIKYSILFENTEGNHFVFTAGVGYSF